MDKFPEAFKRFEQSPDYPEKNATLKDFINGFKNWQHRQLSYLQERALKEQVQPELIQRRTFLIHYYKRKHGTQRVYRDKKTGRWVKI